MYLPYDCMNETIEIEQRSKIDWVFSFMVMNGVFILFVFAEKLRVGLTIMHTNKGLKSWSDN